MKPLLRSTARALALAGAVLACLPLQAGEPRQIASPESSVFRAAEAGKRVRTHVRLLVPQGGHDVMNRSIQMKPSATGAPPAPGYAFQTPASLACIYELVPVSGTCNPNKVTQVANGGARAIAIVDAYDYPYAANDLARFSSQFGLPPATLSVVYASGSRPPTNPRGWELEAALDLQWAHATAPRAKLFLVEAASSGLGDMIAAVKVAATLVQKAGGGEVSMSWGSGEFSAEATYDSAFVKNNVVFVASSGDSAGTSWPCVSPNVVCVGGTTLRSSTSGDFLQEVAWDDGGSGFSSYVAAPAYQKSPSGVSLTGNAMRRGVPDVALAADPATPAWVFYTPSDTVQSGWYAVGGTSWAAPAFAGIINAAAAAGNGFATSSVAELGRVYAAASAAGFRDIKAGWCGSYNGASTGPAWDACTGLGASKGLTGK